MDREGGRCSGREAGGPGVGGRSLQSNPRRIWRARRNEGTHLQTIIIYKLGFNQNYYTFTLILLVKIVVQ